MRERKADILPLAEHFLKRFCEENGRPTPTLSPEFRPNDAVRHNAAEVMRHRLAKSFSPGNFASTMLELNEFVQTLPGRMNRVLDHVADNQISFKVDAIDEAELIGGMQKIANRITLGLVLAAVREDRVR